MERIEIKNSYTPIDLFKSSAVCIEEQKYPRAVELYASQILFYTHHFK
jgi:hypothetical protein